MVNIRSVMLLTLKRFTFLVLFYYCDGYNWTRINLPDTHVPFLFRNYPDIKSECHQDDTCPFKAALEVDRCWGYEENCPNDQRLTSPECSDNDPNRRRRQLLPSEAFWQEGDFGYVKNKISELITLCKGKSENDSTLSCTWEAAYCHATHLYIDMRHDILERSQRKSYRNTAGIWREGDIGGHCKLDKQALEREGGDIRELSTWYAELERFTQLDLRPIDDRSCDVIFDKPVIFMKLDAGGNMYHHFCDFFNLYLSQHINGSSFSTDVQIVFWILNYPRYGDLFKETFDAFTEHEIDFLANYHGKRLCFKEAVFPVLARAKHGLFYNTPLTPGCKTSGLFKAFSEHIVHRLQIPSEMPNKTTIRITMLDRSTKDRNILNQDELLKALQSVPEYDIKLIAFKYRVVPFLEQLKISHNSDIFIGMHGAGLTHMLFQPDWGAVIEVYNCDDAPCYRDLASLRGLNYLTWEKEDKVYPEDPFETPKSTNYTFDVDEFLRLVSMAAKHVTSHPLFKDARGRRPNDEL